MGVFLLNKARIEGGEVAGYENIKDFGFDKRTADEQRQIAVAGGKASGAARRRKADFRKTLNALLTAKIDSPEWSPFLELLGIDSTLEAAVNAAMIREALAGNVKAYEAIAKYSGQSQNTEADDEEQKIRTDRARRARDHEVGNEDNTDGIQSFLKAMRPTQEELDSLYAVQDQEDEEDEGDAEESEETGDV